MELGEKLLRARLEAGLSQRQLCGEEITRNMLSQIEHGKAKPSMKTLRILAERLGKPVSYFLEENALLSANLERMMQARQAHLAGDHGVVRELLSQYQEPDDLFQWERELLSAQAALELAEAALESGKVPYARELLGEAERISYPVPGLERQKALLRCALGDIGAEELPGLDGELLLRARAALAAGQAVRCTHLLEAMEDHGGAEWSFLRGRAYLEQREFARAAECFHEAEADLPEQAAEYLEQCYRELEDYKQAYFYACKRKQREGK